MDENLAKETEEESGFFVRYWSRVWMRVGELQRREFEQNGKILSDMLKEMRRISDVNA